MELIEKDDALFKLLKGVTVRILDAEITRIVAVVGVVTNKFRTARKDKVYMHGGLLVTTPTMTKTQYNCSW